MKRIAMSFATIAAVFALAVSATSAYFTSTATVTGNTFSTGVLELRVNGQPSVVGGSFSAMAPNQVGTSGEFHINNYGAPYFAGPSNLTAKKVTLNVTNANGDSGLWNNLWIKVYINRGWTPAPVAFNGYLRDLANVDLLSPFPLSGLPAGESMVLTYEVWLPDSGSDQNALMGKTVSWDFAVEGRTN